jgi:hypothetical protein
MRILAQLNRRERIATAVCVAFIAATLLLSILDRMSLFHVARSMMDPNYQQLLYTGTIVIPDKIPGQCRFTQYDNKTSEFRNTEIADCYSKSRINSPISRMDSLRDAFSK